MSNQWGSGPGQNGQPNQPPRYGQQPSGRQPSGQQPYGQYGQGAPGSYGQQSSQYGQYGQNQPNQPGQFGQYRQYGQYGHNQTNQYGQNPYGQVDDPTAPIRTGREAQIPIVDPTPPPKSRAPFIVVGGVILATIAVLVISGVATWRADQAKREASPTPQPGYTGTVYPSTIRPYSTGSCKEGLFEVSNFERSGSNLFIEVKISCTNGDLDVDPDMLAIFDKDSVAYRNVPPYDRQAFTGGIAGNGVELTGWTSYRNVPSGEITVLLLGYSRTVAAVPITA